MSSSIVTKTYRTDPRTFFQNNGRVSRFHISIRYLNGQSLGPQNLAISGLEDGILWNPADSGLNPDEVWPWNRDNWDTKKINYDPTLKGLQPGGARGCQGLNMVPVPSSSVPCWLRNSFSGLNSWKSPEISGRRPVYLRPLGLPFLATWKGASYGISTGSYPWLVQ